MPLTVTNPRDLFLTVLSDLLFVERQQAFKVLPELLMQVADPELTHVLTEHLEETRRHASDLEDVFRSAEAEPSSDHSFAFGGMEEQRAARAGNVVTPRLRDAFNAAAAAHAEHYEIAAYRSLIALIPAVPGVDTSAVLERNLEDERRALVQLEQAVERLAQSPDS